jgi:hypothetical protein
MARLTRLNSVATSISSLSGISERPSGSAIDQRHVASRSPPLLRIEAAANFSNATSRSSRVALVLAKPSCVLNSSAQRRHTADDSASPLNLIISFAFLPH